MFWHKRQWLAFVFKSRCSADSMHIGFNILRNIELNHPIHHWKIESSWSNVSTDQNTILLLAESKVNGHTLFLLLMSLQFVQRWRKPKLPKSFINEPHLFACWCENNHFLFMMGFKEWVQYIKLVLRLYHHVILHEFGWCLVNCVDVFLFFFRWSYFIMLDRVQENTFRIFHALFRQFVDLVV